MISIGFDPAFLDIIIKAYDTQGSLIKELPPPGHHHRILEVNKMAGGNGVNVAYVLKKLEVPIELVVPTNEQFSKLLEERGLQVSISIHDQVNETYALTWYPGEIQFNHVTAELGFSHWTDQIHQKWNDSKIHIYLNWGLNPKSAEWISLQWLGSCGWEYGDLPDKSVLVETALEAESVTKPIFIEPGSFENHHNRDQLHQLLHHICSVKYEGDFPVLSYNEEEAPLFSNVSPPSSIYHSPDVVKFSQDGDVVSYPVERSTNIHTLVGAGDSFLAGLIAHYYHERRIEIPQGIKVAKRYIEGYL